MKTLSNRCYIKFMQLEIGIFSTSPHVYFDDHLLLLFFFSVTDHSGFV